MPVTVSVRVNGPPSERLGVGGDVQLADDADVAVLVPYAGG